MINPFFIKRKNIKINDILLCLNHKKIKKNYVLDDIKDLKVANKKDITFFHSIKYLDLLKKNKIKISSYF